MIRITPTSEQVEYARTFLEQGSVAHRKDFDGDFFKQLFGITAQIIVCDFLGVPRPKNTGNFDGGVDLSWNGKTWDVKCEIRSCFFRPGKFVHNLSGHQLNYAAEGYIFVNYNRGQGIYEICGYILKEHFKGRAKYYGYGENRVRDDGTIMTVQGTKGLWEISDNALTKFPGSKRC